MEYDQILDNLKKKIYHPVYFLGGEEPYYIDLISDYIEANVLPPEQKGFNQSVFDGKDTDKMTVLETCRRYPMMADHQVIIVKEAQAWKDLSPLVRYLKAPCEDKEEHPCYHQQGDMFFCSSLPWCFVAQELTFWLLVLCFHLPACMELKS